jgi:hypothetical protein
MIVSLVLGASAISASAYVVPPAELEPSTYSAWAHKHWVWLHHGQSNQENTTNLVNGYLGKWNSHMCNYMTECVQSVTFLWELSILIASGPPNSIILL